MLYILLLSYLTVYSFLKNISQLLLRNSCIIDEPELGLHPYSINVLAGMIKSISKKIQVIMSTQSVTLVNQFTPEDIIIVDRKDGQSVFKHIEESQLKNWLEDYSVGDAWEKNIIGGRP